MRVNDLYPERTHLIGGRWVRALSGESIDILNPATSEVITSVPRGAGQDVNDAVEAAGKAFPAWRDTSPMVRADLLRAWASRIRERADEVDELERLDVGRPKWEKIANLPDRITYVAGLADKVQGASLPTHNPNTLAMTVREPYGVVGSIIPWNAPGLLFVSDVAPAIGAGNTIVVKPAEDAPLVPLFLAQLAQDVGIPDGVINVVTGYGAEAGAALAAHPGVKKISFTGSPATGSAVMAAGAKNVTPVHLELGGKSPQVIFADANLDKAIPDVVVSITKNTGQICAAGSRVVVERSIYSEVVDRIRSAFLEVRIGRWDEPVEMGPLINARQLARVRNYIDVGQSEGARLVTGGAQSPVGVDERGNFVMPTLFDNVQPDMRIAREEIFGPVLVAIPVESEAEAILAANDTDYGLNAAVWTRDVGRAVRVSKAIQAGQVHVNASGAASIIGAPFGGYKLSGFGRSQGADAVEDYTQIKTISFDGDS